MEALLPDYGWPVAGWGIERGHRRVEKGRRGDKAKALRIFEGNRRSRWGGEMGGGVDCVLEKVFNPQGTGCGVGTPDSALRPKLPYREF